MVAEFKKEYQRFQKIAKKAVPSKTDSNCAKFSTCLPPDLHGPGRRPYMGDFFMGVQGASIAPP